MPYLTDSVSLAPYLTTIIPQFPPGDLHKNDDVRDGRHDAANVAAGQIQLRCCRVQLYQDRCDVAGGQRPCLYLTQLQVHVQVCACQKTLYIFNFRFWVFVLL